MAEFPFLAFAMPNPVKRERLFSGGSKLILPTPAEQAARLDTKFADIAKGIDALKTSLDGASPEEVVVFETLGDQIDGFAKAAKKIPGMEWIGELDLGNRAPSDGFEDASEASKPLNARLYAVFGNQAAIQKLLSLWTNWTAIPDSRAKIGFGPFKSMFQHLFDVRRWGPKDRLEETGILDDWKFEVEHATKPIRFEVELWCRESPGTNTAALSKLTRLVQAEGGTVITSLLIETIRYHGVLVDLPSPAVHKILEAVTAGSDTELVRCREVMFFRPRGQSAFSGGEPATERISDVPTPSYGEPIVAVLDGHPLTNHSLLGDRVIVDDPDDFESRYHTFSEFAHGTSMCSLVLHGDLNDPNKTSLSSRIYIRPIMHSVPAFDGTREETPDNILLVDLLHRAIRRIFEGDGSMGPEAPSVRIVNLSFGNSHQPFIRSLSPLARLLDWLGWKYKILFLVSAGNQLQPITLEGDPAFWEHCDETELRSHTQAAIFKDQPNRLLFSPAESVNALTVGAWHKDHAPMPVYMDNRLDLLSNASVPSPLATITAGFRRSAKPEIYFSGGRQLYRKSYDPQNLNLFNPRPYPTPGIKSAAPGTTPMELDFCKHYCGSSDATALASHTAALTYERLVQYQNEGHLGEIPKDNIAVVLKALLGHGAEQGEARHVIDALLKSEGLHNWQKRHAGIFRFLGGGLVDPNRTMFCTDERATMIAWGDIEEDAGWEYVLPLPPSLGQKKLWRRLTATLAWLTPISVRHRNYRQASLWIDFDHSKSALELLQIETAGLDDNTSSRGTLQHRVWEGEASSVFDREKTTISVNCKSETDKSKSKQKAKLCVPFALVVSLEVAEGVDIPIYQEIRDRIRIAPRTR